MKLQVTYRDLIYLAIIGLLLWLAFKDTAPDNSAEVDRLKFERDSIISAMIDVSKSEQLKYHKLVDSCKNYVIYYEKADSINKYKSKHERAKIKKFTRTERDAVRDSIYKSNGIHVSPR